ncbi:hypothetical protein SCALIN_C25_0021 [Candidatus Scalindua japonica]|uniref:Uncharacterized protein n=1 Tax=Candidatus Scalindua japonica TaxID=1284222 RepID=A0A286U0C4_9BACT|nr:hypothetical protein [Candidatus Scalindua japonica]GAX61574.1 hypothetical protein SCALIN_C25_0021 [Candidatus Scalindua japonica]
MKQIPRRKDIKNKEPLAELLNFAEKDDLVKLVLGLAARDNSIRRECLDTLKETVKVSNVLKEGAASSALLSLWRELEPELAELDEYGGGDHGQEDDVSEYLSELCDKLDETTLSKNDRDELLEEVLRYIQSGNAGMDDFLYDVAYATCKNDDDLRDLAERFEALKSSWPTDHARRIYRRIGDHKKFLALRALTMKYGMDYYDLATFYWETGEKDKALDIAIKGMKSGEGRMDELRLFLAERAKESGDRNAYLDYLFLQKTDRLALSSYKEFKKECSDKEWKEYEPRIVDLLEKSDNVQSLKIYMHRKEYEKAIQCFIKISNHSYYRYMDSDILQIASRLENRYPEEILTFHKSSTGNLNSSTSRKDYRFKAEAVKRVRHILVDVMKKPADWRKYVLPIKMNNMGRPAFQEEFAKVIPEWKELK